MREQPDLITSQTARQSLPRTNKVVEAGIVDGLHLGAQLYVSIAERPVANCAWGESRPGVLMNVDTIMLWLSSAKPVTAVAILQLHERGRLELDDLVADHIPEFAARDKQTVTLRHLLTHTGGFRWVDVGWPESSWDEIIRRICDAPLEADWVPGAKAGYHPQTSWYILGEIVRRIDGRALSDYVRQEVFEPLGMHDSWIGMPADHYRAYGQRIGAMPDMTKRDQPMHRYAQLAGATACVPGGNGQGPIRELGFFFEALLQGGQRGGHRILEAQSVAQLTSRVRQGMYDQTFKHVIDWGLGVIVNSNRYGADTMPYGFGPFAGPDAFGHGGAQSSEAFADPTHRLVVAAVFNGMPGERAHDRRMRAFNAALVEDLGLAREE